MTAMHQPSTGLAEATEAWRRVGDLIIGGLFKMEARQDRMEGDIAVLKADVAVLKTDVAGVKTDVASLKSQLTRHELATERGFQRVDAQFERLIGLIQRDETKL